jgi:hypothetical protein
VPLQKANSTICDAHHINKGSRRLNNSYRWGSWKRREISMKTRSTKPFTCLIAALAVVVLSSELSFAEDNFPKGMDPKFVEMFSTLQKRAAEANDAFIRNIAKGSDIEKNGTPAGHGADLQMDKASKFIESLSDFQKKAFGVTTDSQK